MRTPWSAGRSLAIIAALLAVVVVTQAATAEVAAAYTNPTIPEIRAKLSAAGAANGIPPEILYGIAFQESTWRQFDANGDPLIGYDGLGIGLMQVTSYVLFGFDVERLKTDIDYNIACGVEILLEKRTWTPVIGDGAASCYENWFYAVWAYNAWTASNPYPYQVWTHIATGPEGWWTGVPVTPVPESSLVGGLGVAIPTPQPAHYWDPAIAVTAPTAASSWPSGSTQTVAWTASWGPASGQFLVALVNSTTGVWYAGKYVLAEEGRTDYVTQVTAAAPAGSYRAAVYWRPTAGSGAWTVTRKSAAFTVTPINITMPGATTIWPTQATRTVAWNVNPAMSGGQFLVALVNQASRVWYVNKLVPATAGKTSYAANVNTLVPAGRYKAAVYWRATVGSGSWTATQKSPAFTVAALMIEQPTASSSWPRLTTQEVVWSVTPGPAGGEFRVSLVNQATGTWYVNKTVPAVPGQTPYATPVSLNVPAGPYKVAVYWRPAGSTTWVLTKKTAAFTVS